MSKEKKKLKPIKGKGWFRESQKHREARLKSLDKQREKYRKIKDDKVEKRRRFEERIKVEEEVHKKTTRPMLGYPGGKSKLAKRIIKEIPTHETYVEPFVGGGSVFFAKPPAKKEVINDKDKNLVEFYKFFRDIDVKKINEFDLKPNRNKFERLQKEKPKSKLSKVHKFLYINKHSYGSRGQSFNPNSLSRDNAGKNIKTKAGYYQKRLNPVKVLNQDFKTVIQKYDSKDTFYYLDPPYYKTKVTYDNHDITPKDVFVAVKGMKGKFLLSYNNVPEVRKEFKDYKIKRVTTNYSFATGGYGYNKTELLIKNY